MNPSYDNGVGSSQIPPQMPQQPVVPSQPLPQQPVVSGQPVSSGTGDIVLGGADSGKKSRKGVVILIILVVVLALVGGGVLLWQNLGSGNSNQSQTASLEEKYNSYVNYVLWGVESDGKPDLAAIKEATNAYFEDLRDDALLNGYISKANEKYIGLADSYGQKEGENKVDVAVLKSYFEDYSAVKQISNEEIARIYVADGQAAVEKMIDQNYKTVGNEKYLNDYLAAEKKLATVNLDLIVKGTPKGCVQDGRLVLSCYGLNDEEAKMLNDAIFGAMDAVVELKTKAFDSIQGLYDELYGNEENEND